MKVIAGHTGHASQTQWHNHLRTQWPQKGRCHLVLTQSTATHQFPRFNLISMVSINQWTSQSINKSINQSKWISFTPFAAVCGPMVSHTMHTSSLTSTLSGNIPTTQNPNYWTLLKSNWLLLVLNTIPQSLSNTHTNAVFYGPNAVTKERLTGLLWAAWAAVVIRNKEKHVLVWLWWELATWA